MLAGMVIPVAGSDSAPSGSCSGTTNPAEMISLAPSSMLMSSSTTSDFGTYMRKPVVGLGVHGMKTATSGSALSSTLALISVVFSDAMKTSDHTPLRGYSTTPTLENMFDLSDSTVSRSCFSAL